MFVIISSCSARKDDLVSIRGSRVVEPSDYLGENPLLSALLARRTNIFADPRAQTGKRTTYAFDLYVRTGKAYKNLYANRYQNVREALVNNGNIEWFFISGGYGIIHALEAANNYQATFSQTIAHQNHIPYTSKIWGNLLPTICDAVISRYRPESVYVFGSQDYTQFIKQTNHWKHADNITIFESTGSAGPLWLSPILDQLMDNILKGQVDRFDQEHPAKFTKQMLR